jgi:hypothetical protein
MSPAAPEGVESPDACPNPAHPLEQAAKKLIDLFDRNFLHPCERARFLAARKSRAHSVHARRITFFREAI